MVAFHVAINGLVPKKGHPRGQLVRTPSTSVCVRLVSTHKALFTERFRLEAHVSSDEEEESGFCAVHLFNKKPRFHDTGGGGGDSTKWRAKNCG